LKESAKFVGDFKSLAKEADESLAKHKALELEIKRLLKAVFSQDIMNIVFDQKDNTQDTSKNTKFAKQSILGKPPMLDEIHALSKPVTSNSVSTPQDPKVLKNDKVIAPGMFRINPDKTFREEKNVPNTVSASARTKPITVSQPLVFTKTDVNSDLNGLSSTGVDNTKTRRPKEDEVKEHHRNLLLSKNKKHISSTCNNIKIDSEDVISKVVCAMSGSENRPPILNKEYYVPWSSCLLRYAKSRPPGKLVHNTIINVLYVRRMIPEPGDPNREVPINETFHVQTDDELTEKELKQIEVDDQAIQTILLGLPEDIYEPVDSCETAQEIWLRVQQMMKGSDIGIQEKKANNLKFLNNLQPEWSRHITIVHQTKDLHTADYTQLYDFLKYNQKDVDDLKAKRLAKTQDPLALMAISNNPNTFPVLNQYQPSSNQNYMQQPIPNPEDVTDPTTAMNIALALMAKAFKLNYSTSTNNNHRISPNPRNRHIAQPGMNMGQDRQMQMVGVQNPRIQNVGNQNGLIGVLWNANQNPNGNGNLIAARAKGNATGHNGNQIRCYNCRREEAGIQLQDEEFDLIAAAEDLDEIEEVNANCILMANLQQASTSGTQTNKALIYDSDGSAEVHNYENCDDNDLFNMFTQEEQYTELLEPIPEPHQVPHNDNNVISEVSSVEQSGGTVEQHPANVEETRVLYDSLYNNLAIEVEKVNTKMALGYQNPFYLKQAQQKKQSLYDGKVLLKKHDPPVMHDSEKTLQLAQESRLKMKQLNKEIKTANYSKINHLSGVFVSQIAKSRKELYFLNTFKTANASKPISIPNEEFLDDTTPSVAQKFLNEVKITIVTLQRVVKQRMTLKTHNWSSSAHKELHKIVKDEIFPIVYQVDARVQNFEIQFLKESAKFVGDFKSLAKEADESLAKHKALEFEIERLLREVISQDIMSVVQNNSVDETSNLQTELERMKERFENYIIKKENEYAKLWNDWYKKCEECKFNKISNDKAYNDMQKKIEQLQARLEDLKGKSKDTSCSSDTLNPLSQKLENKNMKLEFQDTTRGMSRNTKFGKQSILGKPPKVSENHALSKPVTSNTIPTPQESKVVKNDKVIALGVFRINPCKPFREEKHVPNKVRASARTNPITVSQPPIITKKVVNSDSNGLSSTGVYNTKTRRPQPKSNTKNDRVPSASKSSRSKNKEVDVEEHHRKLLLSENKKHLSSESIATACFTQNRSIIHCHFNKTPYELINERKPDISFLHVFGALCYPKNDREDIGKLGAKGDIGFFIGYSADSCAFRVFNRRTKKIMETMNVSFDEHSAMALEQRSSKPGLQSMTSRKSVQDSILLMLRLLEVFLYILAYLTGGFLAASALLVLTSAQSAAFTNLIMGLDMILSDDSPFSEIEELLSLRSLELLSILDPPCSYQISDFLRECLNHLKPIESLMPHFLNLSLTWPFVEILLDLSVILLLIKASQQALIPLVRIFVASKEDVNELNLQQQHAQQQGNQVPIQPKTIADNVPNAMFDANTFVNPFATSSTSAAESSSSQYVDPSNTHTNQLRSEGDMCMYALTMSIIELKNVKEAMTDLAWIESMQEELLQFKWLDIWVLVPAPDNITPLTLKWLF
nr:retrovirus-related Pol polyprotein from transposon TNT 1-94 [Tanacetum cinerariifolium]